MRAGP